MAYYCVGGFLELKAIAEGKDYVNKSQANYIKRMFLKKDDAPKIEFKEIRRLDLKPKRRAWVISCWPDFKEACAWLGFSLVEAEMRCFIKAEDFEFTDNNTGDIGNLKDYGGEGGKGPYKKKQAPQQEKPAQELSSARNENGQRITDPLVKAYANGNMQLLVREINGELFFPATETARFLGYKNPTKAIQDHCNNSLRIVSTSTSSGIRNLNFITESDLYRLILRSNLPSAQRFQDWIVCDVLPSIRKKGSYSTDQNKNISLDDVIDAFKRSLTGDNPKVEENSQRHDKSILTPSQRETCLPILDRKAAYYQSSKVNGLMKKSAKLKFLPMHHQNECTWHDIRQKDFEELVDYWQNYRLSDIEIASIKRFQETPRGKEDKLRYVRRQGFEVNLDDMIK